MRWMHFLIQDASTVFWKKVFKYLKNQWNGEENKSIYKKATIWGMSD